MTNVDGRRILRNIYDTKIEECKINLEELIGLDEGRDQGGEGKTARDSERMTEKG